MNRSRHGKTLIEMIILISLLSVMLSIAGTTFVALFRAETRGRDSVITRNSVSRLSTQFREDVRAAVNTELQVDEEGRNAALVCRIDATELIRYEIVSDGVRREKVRDEQISGREFYTLSNLTVEFIREAEPVELVSLVFDSSPHIDKPGTRNRYVKISATPGRDRGVVGEAAR